ncbi:MAG TPA: c-type cytochrome biogenesis protein CcmI [Gammaproteobacteria bacterium]|nr:c-type cytochrome biogenesis protein CcmI [Gammaproteobacteria bacterium]
MNVAIFVLIGVALLGGLLFSLLRALRRSPAVSPAADEQAVISIYQNRLQQARQQFDNGELDANGYEQAQQDLSDALGYELQSGAQDQARPAKPGKALSWTLGLALPLLAASLYLWLGRPQALDPAAANTQLSIMEMVSRLEQRLKSNPDDVQGWRMLGRSYSVLQNYPAAASAYGEVYKRGPKDPAIVLDYAEAIARANGNNVLGRPAELIDEALQLEPANTRALLLKGIVQFHLNDGAGAVRTWQSVLALPQLDEETRSVVQNLIEQSRQLAGGSAAPAQAAPPKAASPAGPSITVELSLSPQLASQVAAGDTVFVFAQAANGPKMPLAVARRRAAELPLKLVLDDSSAMAQGMNLSSFNQVVVSARVSKSGNASAASGDLLGKSAVLDPAAKPSIKLVIDTKLP